MNAEHDPTIQSQNDDRSDVHVTCSCGDWEFRGDWDEMAVSWMEHERDPRYQYLYIGRGTTTFLTRAGEQRLVELLDDRRNDDGSRGC